MKTRKKFINAIVSAFCAAAISVGAIIGIASNRSGNALAATAKNFSSEEYARLLHVNDLKEVGSRPAVYDELYTTDYDAIVYNRQKGNNWGYFSMACCLTSKLLGLATGGLSELGTKALGAGACFFLRESMLQKVGDSTAEMLNKTIDVLNDTMNRQFADLKNEIAVQTDTLNKSITAATNTIINELQKTTYKEKIDEFNKTAFSNRADDPYGYDGWKSDLEERFNSVVNAEANAPADPAEKEAYIKNVYDNFYYVAARANVTLYDYIMGTPDAENDSILEILYNNYLLGVGQNNFNLDAALYNCIQFAQDLYNNYLFGNTCLQLAFMYQSDYQTRHELKGDYILENKNSVTKTSVENYFNGSARVPSIEQKIKNVETEILRFYTRVLALSESYTYAGSDGKVYGNVIYNTLYNNTVPFSVEVTLNNNSTGKFTVCHNSVRKGDTLYMQDVPASLSSTMNTSLSFKSSDESLATVTQNGTVSVVGASGSFDISLMAGDDVIYSRTFKIGAEAFSGGFGTQAVPYLISNASDLKFLADHSEYWVADCHFLLTADIGLNGVSIGKIGTGSNYFNGVFDGNNHVISNKSGDALFETIGGTVKNLTLSGFTITGYNLNTNQFYGGILCLYNRGTIENCHIVGSSVTANHKCALSGGSYYLENYIFYGAIAANYGTVRNSSAIGVKVSSSLVSHYNGFYCYPNVFCYSGALVGFNNANAKITDCLAKSNDIYSHIYNRSKVEGFGKNKRETTAYFILGGLVGESHEQATVSKCISYGNNPHRDWQHSEDDSSGLTWFGSISSHEEVNLRQTAGKCYGAMTSCYSSAPTTDGGNKDVAIANMPNQDKTNFSANGWDFSNASQPILNGVPVQLREVKSITAVTPVKTTYHLGEKLNLAGFAVLSDSGKVLTNATVKQPDMNTIGEKVVEVVWNGLKTSFKINVLCTHNYVEEKVITVGNCVTNGEKLYSCSICHDKQTLVTPAVGHSYKQVVTEATCLTDGSTTHTCELCGDSYVDNRITALGHSYADKVVAPTCTEKGYTTHTCTRCDESYTDTEVAALGHNLAPHEAKAPTCEEVGWEAYDACTRCDYTTYKELAPLGHDWGVWVIAQSPTCTVAGEMVRTCRRDSTHEETKDIPALGHEWGEWVEVKAATCTETGQAQRTCGRDSTHEETKDIPALGHKWGEWTSTKAATCTEAGQEQRTCISDTAHKENREVPALGHEWGEWVEVKAATCTEVGQEQRTCTHDTAHKDDRDIPALGHDTVSHEAQAPTYTEKGWNAYETCTRCDYTTYQELEALGLARKFKDEVGSIENDPYNGIKAALATYATLTAEDKEDVVAEYAKLEKAIADYNQKAEKLNESYDSALSVALKATVTAVAAVSALAAAAFVLGKRV